MRERGWRRDAHLEEFVRLRRGRRGGRRIGVLLRSRRGVEARRAFSFRLAIETYWVFDATRSCVPLIATSSSGGGRGLGLQRISDEVKRIGGPGLDGLIHRCGESGLDAVFLEVVADLLRSGHRFLRRAFAVGCCCSTQRANLQNFDCGRYFHLTPVNPIVLVRVSHTTRLVAPGTSPGASGRSTRCTASHATEPKSKQIAAWQRVA